jgi:hypothetical protein
MHPNRTRTGALAVAAVLLTLTTTPAIAEAGDRANHCDSPSGIDLNEAYDTDDAFATLFCSDGHAGDWWRPLVRWVGAPTHDVTPEGYEPVGETPQLDFLAKLASTRYVIDAGTGHEQALTFDPDELLIVTGTLADGSEFVAYTPRLHPLTPGEHTIDLYATMSAESWDGLGLQEEHRLPPGELLLISVTLTVHAGTFTR